MLGICDNCGHTAEIHDSVDNPVCTATSEGEPCECCWYVNSEDRFASSMDSIRINSKYFSPEPVLEPTVMMVGRLLSGNRKSG